MFLEKKNMTKEILRIKDNGSFCPFVFMDLARRNVHFRLNITPLLLLFLVYVRTFLSGGHTICTYVYALRVNVRVKKPTVFLDYYFN